MFIYAGGFLGLIMTIVFCVGFGSVKKRSLQNEREIASMRVQISALLKRVSQLEGETSDVRLDFVTKKSREEDQRIEEINKQIEHNLRQKYEDHIIAVTNRTSAERFSKSDIRSEIFAPKDWPENASGSHAAWYAQYKYYEDVFLIVNKSKKTEDIAVEVCEEAYRLIGFLGINLSGQNSEIMSWYCDYEQKIYGKSARLRTMCQKLDSIGILDRGRAFGERMK